MIVVLKDITPEVLSRAEAFSRFRADCKCYLQQVGYNFDKFTVVEHDSYIGYVSEKLIRDYLQNHLPAGYIVKAWEDDFNMRRIINAVRDSDVTEADYVKSYFYDSWDICIESPNGRITIDVKTALTKLTPKLDWDFLYPVVQANKPGKDYSLLAYCCCSSDDYHQIEHVNIIGYCRTEDIRHCRILRAGWRTKFGTVNRIDNYETQLQTHYKDIHSLVQSLKPLS